MIIIYILLLLVKQMKLKYGKYLKKKLNIYKLLEIRVLLLFKY